MFKLHSYLSFYLMQEPWYKYKELMIWLFLTMYIWTAFDGETLVSGEISGPHACWLWLFKRWVQFATCPEEHP